MEKERTEAMLMASFAADSLALGAHWIYDTDKIVKTFGRVETLLKPPQNSYHSGKDKGEFTHYGDQTFVLLESVVANKGFDLRDFAERWQNLFSSYKGYFDEATKSTLSNFSSGKSPEESGSSSTDLAGAARIAPLVLCYRDQLETLVEMSRTQTRMTHNHPEVLESAAFFAETTWKVLHGSSPVAAMKEVAQKAFDKVPIAEWVGKALESTTEETRSVIGRFGQSCHTEDAFPSVVHLIARYENDLRNALIENVMAGGDSAARGMIVGMVLGAYLGLENIPRQWMTGLKNYLEIKTLSDKVQVKDGV